MSLEIIKAIHKRLEDLGKTSKNIEKLRCDEPEGSLRISSGKGRILMYQRKEPSERSGRYIPKSERELARRLATKGYLVNAARSIQKEEKLLLQYLDDCEGNTFEDVYDRLSEPRKQLVDPLTETDEMFVRRWLAEEYIQKSIDDVPNPFVSKQGEKFRSKSEFIIAEELRSAGVPYKYERQVRIGPYKFYPDFTVVNVAQRREYLWEHFGMMDMPDYLEGTIFKYKTYTENGYFPGVNLIMTWETAKSSLDVEMIRRLISEFLTKK